MWGCQLGRGGQPSFFFSHYLHAAYTMAKGDQASAREREKKIGVMHMHVSCSIIYVSIVKRQK